MKLQPSSGVFRQLCGAAIAYGLTEGGCNADLIAVTDLGRRVVTKVLEDTEGLAARREAVLRPRVLREFLQKYDGAKMPREDVALKILESLHVPATAQRTGAVAPPSLEQADPREKRVFVTHGKNREFIPQIKELLEFGQFQPVVSIERESVSKPIPDKVMDDMRSCGAAIIHVDADREVRTHEGEKEVVLNGNVLIEIGGAMALYGRRFILLVKEGIRLPSNLQGLYEVRYTGDKLDGDATLRLLKAFNEFKGVPVAKFS